MKTLVLLAGLAQFGMVALGTQIPRVFGWVRDLARLRPANRRLFWVYGLFVLLANVGFGTLSIVFAEELARGEGLAGGLSLFLGLYWVARLVVQYAAFDTPDWPEEGRRPLARHGVGLVTFAMAAVYLAAFLTGVMT